MLLCPTVLRSLKNYHWHVKQHILELPFFYSTNHGLPLSLLSLPLPSLLFPSPNLPSPTLPYHSLSFLSLPFISLPSLWIILLLFIYIKYNLYRKIAFIVFSSVRFHKCIQSNDNHHNQNVNLYSFIFMYLMYKTYYTIHIQGENFVTVYVQYTSNIYKHSVSFTLNLPFLTLIISLWR